MVVSCRNPLTIGLGDNVDLQSPELAVSSHANGAYVRGTIDLEGTYADDMQSATVRVSLDAGATFGRADVDPAAKRWSFTVDTTAVADGGRDVIVTATDGAGKTVERRILLYFDNTPPVVLVKVPLAYAYPPNEYNGTVSIRGDATDQFPIARVGVKVYNASGTLLASSTGDIGTNSWSYNFPSVGLVAGIENCDVVVTATDRAGNQNSTFYHTADVTDLQRRGRPLRRRGGGAGCRQCRVQGDRGHGRPWPCCRPGASSPSGSTRGSTCPSSTSTTPTRPEPPPKTCSPRLPRRSAWSPTTPKA